MTHTNVAPTAGAVRPGVANIIAAFPHLLTRRLASEKKQSYNQITGKLKKKL